MTINIRYFSKAPEQIEGVLMATVYTDSEHGTMPELIIHFQDYSSGQRAIPLTEIKNMTFQRLLE